MAPAIGTRPTFTTTTLAIAGTSALLATSCGAGQGDVARTTDDPGPSTSVVASPSPSPSPLSSPSSSASPTPGRSASDPPPQPASVDLPPLDAECVLEPPQPEARTIRYVVPSSWQVEGSCELLDPTVEELPDSTEPGVAVVVDVSDAAYGDVLEPGRSLTATTRWVGARANLPSARVAGEHTGEGLRPAGTPSLSWAVDLDAGSDDPGGVLLISTAASTRAGHDLAVAVADSIAQTVVVRPPAEGPTTSPDERGFAITRVEDGPDPYAVTYDGDCFALRPGGPTHDVADEVCGLDPTADEVVSALLGEDVLVGYASPLAVTVSTPALGGPYGITTPVEGSSLFAFRVDADRLPTDAVVHRAGGGVLARTEVG